MYYLRSYFKRSNDFGYGDKVYENTSFYENRISFTGNIDFNDNTRMTIDTTVDGDSRGTGNNLVYSREVKEKVLGTTRLSAGCPEKQSCGLLSRSVLCAPAFGTFWR